MAKKIKAVVEEESTEETVIVGAMSADLNSEGTEIEIPKSEAIEKGLIQEDIPKKYIPDAPAQMLTEEPLKLQSEGIIAETEVEFLLKILQIQEDGGFGRHLNKVIHERIKLIS